MADEFRVFHKLQVAHSALFRAADQRVRAEFGLSTTQLAVLFALSRSDGVPISRISRTLAMGKSSLTGLVDRMCANGLVRRVPSDEDGRIINIHLCDKGRALVHDSKDRTRHFNTALLAPFSDAERRTIDRFLTHLRDNADDIINPTKAHT